MAAVTPAQVPVHPRACGEQTDRSVPTANLVGSSPRVRGTDFVFGALIRVQRFIPARAGNRERQRSISGSEPVHPRACGEQTSADYAETTNTGSSPRVRGTGQLGPPRLFLARFIPARAGTEPLEPDNFRPLRFIPARAGNREGGLFFFLLPSVHPRACGEQGRRSSGLPRSIGSSPRVRGTAMNETTHPWDRRFIPARAGNRCAGDELETLVGPVHPRACGEQEPPLIVSSVAAGSSPRVRGTGPPPPPLLRLLRFIPARAGNRCLSMKG